jgi:hypothetical protein
VEAGSRTAFVAAEMSRGRDIPVAGMAPGGVVVHWAVGCDWAASVVEAGAVSVGAAGISQAHAKFERAGGSSQGSRRTLHGA